MREVLTGSGYDMGLAFWQKQKDQSKAIMGKKCPESYDWVEAIENLELASLKLKQLKRRRLLRLI